MITANSRAGRGPAVVYGVLLVSLVVLLATLAFSARQPPPPQIAELTPQANQQIHKAPNQLNSSIGSGVNGAGGGTTTTAAAPPATLPNGQPVPTTTPGSVVVPAVHHCFGDPPAQIDTDTQGPPCIAYWSGDNGGATYRGVTSTTIRVGVNSGDLTARGWNDLEEWVNRNFELYGRTVKLIPVVGGQQSCSGEEANADAYWADKMFAVGDPANEAEACYYQEAAHDHMVAVTYDAWSLPSWALAQNAPYLYSYEMPADQQWAEDGAMVCSQLAGKTAQYSPDANLAASKRKFGIIFAHDEDPYNLTQAPLLNALGRCGVHISSQDQETLSYSSCSCDTADQELAQFAVTSMTQMHTDGVTTVFCMVACAGFLVGQDFCSAASSQGYHPEFIFLSTGADANIYVDGGFWPCASEQAALFNMVYQTPQVPYASEPLNRALNQVDPGYQLNEDSASLWNAIRSYEQVLLIASCIQMAGPYLTPTTFEHGCQAASFPNPYSPQMEGIVSFNGGSHSMTTDATLAWWNAAAPSVYAGEPSGSWCYADRAARFSPSSWASAPSILPPAPLSAAPCANSPPGS